ncbi:MAG TPA: 2OG-Fe(II) oxygenase [Gammaproteobacteria bacterium]|nr:2OG-Fe(II) oxygenase [Gammaproteobacteria bacterium]
MKTLDEFVMVFDDMITPELASGLLEEYADSGEWRSPRPQKGHEVDSHSAILVTHELVTAGNARRQRMAAEVIDAITRAFDRYHAKFSRREQGLNFLHVEKLVGVRINRYQTGQYMVNHTDKYPDSDSGQVSWPAVTFSINLNDDFTGGELSLLDGDLVFKAQAAQGIFFPSNFLFPHAVNEVTSGTRYALVGWLI